MKKGEGMGEAKEWQMLAVRGDSGSFADSGENIFLPSMSWGLIP